MGVFDEHGMALLTKFVQFVLIPYSCRAGATVVTLYTIYVIVVQYVPVVSRLLQSIYVINFILCYYVCIV